MKNRCIKTSNGHGTGFDFSRPEDAQPYIVTCAHVLGNLNTEMLFGDLVAFRDNRTAPGRRYRLRVHKIDYRRDLAVCILENAPEDLVRFPLAVSDRKPARRLEVNAYGYPGYDTGHEATLLEAKITKTWVKSLTNYYEIDKTLIAGISGGPQVDPNDGRVLGISITGQIEYKNGQIGGRNAALCATEIIKLLDA
jgi:S1-C subfamily serine protease